MVQSPLASLVNLNNSMKPAEWNCLPNDLRMITHTIVFKKKLKAYFYKQAFCVA